MQAAEQEASTRVEGSKTQLRLGHVGAKENAHRCHQILKQLITRRSEVSSRCTRATEAGHLELPQVRSERARRHFCFRAAMSWNDAPDAVREPASPAPAASAATVTRRRPTMAHLPSVRATSGRPRLPPAHISRPVSFTSLQPLSRASSGGSRSDDDPVAVAAPVPPAGQLPSKYEPLPAIPKRLVRQRTYEVIELVVLKPGTPPSVGPETARSRSVDDGRPPAADAEEQTKDAKGGAEGQQRDAAGSEGEQRDVEGPEGQHEDVSNSEGQRRDNVAGADLDTPREDPVAESGVQPEGDSAPPSEPQAEDAGDSDGDSDGDDGASDSDEAADADEEDLQSSTPRDEDNDRSEPGRARLDVRNDSVEEVEVAEAPDLPTDSLETLSGQESGPNDPSALPPPAGRENNYLKLNNYCTGEEGESDLEEGEDKGDADTDGNR
ncbi:atherin-like [Amphibalanus amphitrite]|uniref:atherin-like n=1 Tax=Amphibalanus amphitrite TaxID=1232801 RepID=UPI001C91547F|nr:atherin-like [Amphibalanus amphitrite]